MSTHLPSEFRGQHSHTVSEMERLCTMSAPSAAMPEVSNTAAALIASGLLSHNISEKVVTRVRAGAGFPNIGHYYLLRHSAVKRARLVKVVQSAAPLAVKRVAETRIKELDRATNAAFTRFTRGKGAFASSTRKIRQERAQGVYLEPEERVELFSALTSTPSGRAPKGLVEHALRVASTVAVKTQAAPTHQPTIVEGGVVTALPEMYSALLLIAGRLFDRFATAIQAPIPEVTDFRVMVDPASELASIAADVTEIRSLAQRKLPGEVHGGDYLTTGLGEEIDTAWAETVERVEVFAQLVLRVETIVSAQLPHLVGEGAYGSRQLGQSPVGLSDNAAATAARLSIRSSDRKLATENLRKLTQEGGGPYLPELD